LIPDRPAPRSYCATSSRPCSDLGDVTGADEQPPVRSGADRPHVLGDHRHQAIGHEDDTLETVFGARISTSPVRPLHLAGDGRGPAQEVDVVDLDNRGLPITDWRRVPAEAIMNAAGADSADYARTEAILDGC